MSRAMLDFVVPWLVDNPEAIEIAEVEGENGEAIFELSVDPQDMGKIIGKNGRIIRSLRTLARATSDRDAAPVLVEVID
ncbi:MAG: KH domain-containing protein [Actinomycetota bacterium]|nr:KH domain-containing protein [Actinomycetota bacterium]